MNLKKLNQLAKANGLSEQAEIRVMIDGKPHSLPDWNVVDGVIYLAPPFMWDEDDESENDDE